MPQDHSSRWSAAASPGGLIGLILTILALMALIASVLSLTDMFDLALSDTVLIVALGVSVFLTVLLVYLLVAYVTISYTLDVDGLKIRCGIWSARIPYDEMEAVGPATDILGDQDSGWQPYWPGYYSGVRKTDLGKVRVIATLPPRRQIAISRFDGETFSISPERPLFFMEELARWHEGYFAELEESEPETTAERPAAMQAFPVQSALEEREASQDTPEFFHVENDSEMDQQPSPIPEGAPAQQWQEPQPVYHEPVEPQPEPNTDPPASTAQTLEHPSPEDPQLPFGYQGPIAEPPEPAPEEERPEPTFGAPVPESSERPTLESEPAQLSESPAEPSPELETNTPAAPEPGPVFGTTAPADEHPSPAPRFGFTPPDVEPSYLPADADSGQSIPADEIPTNQFEVWFPDPPEGEPVPGEVANIVGESDVPAVHQPVAQTPEAATDAPFAPPQPVISPAGIPRREVIQPLTRVQRAGAPATSPAIRPMLHRDPVSLGFVGFGLVAGLAMTAYILVQYDDIPPSLTLHWNAEGLPGRIGEPREIWILPLIAGIVLLANIGLAWSIAQFDRFAARLMLSSTVLTHIVLWIALLMIL